MGDYTQMQLMVHDCPEGEAWALSEVLADRGLSVDWDGPAAERGVLHVGTMYTDRSVAGDESSDLADLIIKAAPGATFIVWTDPAYEWLGHLVRYAPKLGRHDAECTEQGDAMFSERAVLSALGQGAGAVHDLVGSAWTKALEGRAVDRTIRAKNPDPALDENGDWRTCDTHGGAITQDCDCDPRKV